MSTNQKQLTEYESYFFAQDKQDFISKLITGTDTYYYFSLINALNKYGLDLPEEYEQQLKAYSSFKTNRAKNIKGRHLFNQIEKETDKQKRKELFKQINELFFQCNFSYETPYIFTGNFEGDIQVEQHSSKVDEEKLKLQKFLDEAFKSEVELSKIQHSAYTLLDTKKLLEVKETKILELFLNCKNLYELQNIPEVIKHYVTILQEKKQNISKKIKFENLTLAQMLELKEICPQFQKDSDFHGQIFIKTFQVSPTKMNFQNAGSQQEKEEKRKQMIEMYEFAIKNIPTEFKNFSNQLLYEILQIGIEINYYDFDLFIEYLKNPKQVYTCASKQQRLNFEQKNIHYDNNWHNVHKLNISRWLPDNNLILTYVQKYFQKNDKLQPFDEYLDVEYLNEQLTLVQLQNGKIISDITTIFSHDAIQNLKNQKLITICQYNKEFFDSNEEVILYVEIKNIPQLKIKIFELVLENFYLKNNQEIQNDINLDGLIACYEQSFEIDCPSFTKQIKEFKFDLITQKDRGLFIVEFIGNGQSSRAFIKKGRLVVIQKTTANGYKLNILNEKLEVCIPDKENPRTGLWLQNTFHQADQNGDIFIPFQQSAISLNVVLVHNDFASLTNLSLEAENYQFKCNLIYNNEQILMGNKAKFLIQPRLYLNNVPASFKLLKDVQVSVTTVNDKLVPSTQKYEKVEFSYESDYELELPVPAKLNKITFQIKGKVQTLSKDKNDISYDQTITINNYQNQNVFCSQYLRYCQDSGYEIYVLGKNGEPKKNIQLNILFVHLKVIETLNQTLKTDQDGKVSLGFLDQIQQIVSSVDQLEDIYASTKQWTIQQNCHQKYPDQVYLSLNKQNKLKLPIFNQELSRTNFSLVKVHESHIVLEDQFSKLQIQNNQLIVQDLPIGVYKLKLKSCNQEIKILVQDSYQWENTNYVVTKDQLIQQPKQITNLAIEDLNIVQQENSPLQNINFKVSTDDPANTKVHVLSIQFLPDNINEYYQKISENIQKAGIKVVSTSKQKNIYMSNKRLGDEYCYVLDRKNKTRYVGNTLQKPQILIKSTEIRETNWDQEQLNDESNYQEVKKHTQQLKDINMHQDLLDLDFSNQQEKSYQVQSMANRGGLFGMPMSMHPQNDENQVNSMLNFLKNPAVIYSNIKQEENGIYSIKDFNGSLYSTVILIVTNRNQINTQIQPLKKTQQIPESRDLTQKSNLQKDKFYSINRNSSSLQQGQEFIIKDITSTEIQIIDSIQKLFDIQKELRSCNGTDNENEGYDFWQFLKNWNTLTIEEKHQKYDEFACHEINLFIYFKDPAYFDTYVKSFLTNKLEKTFVDYFLLNMNETINQYCSIQKLEKLNSLELILLLISLMKQKDMVEEAQRILKFIEMQQISATVDSKQFKRLFETVLSSKSSPIEAENITQISLFGQQNLAFGQQNMMNMNNNNNFFQAQQFQLPMQPLEFCYRPQQMEMERVLRFVPQAPGMPGMPGMRFRNQSDGSYNSELEEEEAYFQEYEEDFADFGDEQIEQRNQYRQEFKNLEKTKEYGERHYWKIKHPNQFKDRVQINQFWIQLAQHVVNVGLDNEPFLTDKFIYCNKNHTEMLGALAFIGLPFNPEKHEYDSKEGKKLKILSASNMIVFQKEIIEKGSDIKNEILIAQRFFEPQDRYRYSEVDPNLKYEKDVEEYIIDKIYGCQVIITNISVTEQEFQILYEVPEGSIPVQTLDYTKTQTVFLNSFSTKTFEFFFYFPKAGEYGIYSANVARDGIIIAVSKEFTFKVLEKRQKQQNETLDQILSTGSKEDILNFVKTRNLLNQNIFSFESIYHLLKDEQFYLDIITILRERKVFDYLTWSFSIIHGDQQSFIEFINTNQAQIYLTPIFNYFENSVVSIQTIKFLEYHPLVNSRAHQLINKKSNILNIEFRDQYFQFMQHLVERNTIKIEDYLCLIYYLLLQDRIDEAIQIYQNISQEQISQLQRQGKIQYDYISAYIDFYVGFPDFKEARKIVENYLDYPITQWRNLFYDIANQLAEFDGEDIEQVKVLEVSDKESSKKNVENSKKEQILNAELNETKIQVTVQNVSQVEVNYYLIDLEVLFSRNPFLLQNKSDDFALIKPNLSYNQKIENLGDIQKISIDIPENYLKQNVFIQIKSSNKSIQLTYFSCSLEVLIIENYGQIKVTDKENKPLSKVYVKTYAKYKNGSQTFYKDGYTDLRGRFDYASLNSCKITDIEKFAIFVMSDDSGSLMKEVNAPAQIGKIDAKVQLKSQLIKERALKVQQQQENLYNQNQIQLKPNWYQSKK